MSELSVAGLATPLLSFARSAIALAGKAAPHMRRLRAEGQAAAKSDAGETDLLDRVLTETFSRLLGGVADDEWWRRMLDRVGQAYVVPDFLRIHAVQEWLSETDVQADLRLMARATLQLGPEPTADTRERLRESYSRRTGEVRRLADGPIDVVEAILVAGFLASVASTDVPLAAMLQAGLSSIQERFDNLEERLIEGALLDQSIVKVVSTHALDALQPILRRRALVPDRSRQEVSTLERRFHKDGDLRLAARDVHVEVLRWAVRFHAADRKTLPEAIRYRARIREIADAADTQIADARIAATEGDVEGALRRLRNVDSADGRANLFSTLYQSRGANSAIDWFAEQPTRDDADFLTAVGWYNVVVALVRSGRWDEAVDRLARSRLHLTDCPPLAFLEGIVNTAMLFPEPVRSDVLDGAPYLITFSLLEGPAADRSRREALQAFRRASDLLEQVDLREHADEARVISLWLRLTDSATEVADNARAEVIGAMRDGARAVRLLPVVRDLWVPETLAGDFRKFWPVPLMVAPGRG